LTLLDLDAVAARPAEEVGGKAIGLARLAAIGLPVPPARVLPVAAHARWLERGALDEDDRTALAATATQLSAPLAVRSSAADEDSAERSAAGQYESFMGVDGPSGLIDAVEACYRAAESDRARAYRGAGGARVAVVIQEEIEAARAGVAFSVDPVSGDRGAILIEAVFGHGEGIVSGQLIPDRYRVSRRDGTVTARRADKQAMSDGRGRLHPLPPERRLARVLTDPEAREVAALVERAEAGFRCPVDAELCFQGRRVWLVQSRPITTLQ
jgi:pyruvate,water dikinase